MKLDIHLIQHGDVVEVYSAAMQCDYFIRPVQLKESLSRLVAEWVDLQQIDGAGPFSVLIGGLQITDAHSTMQFDGVIEREHYWRTTSLACWLPVGDGWLLNTEENKRSDVATLAQFSHVIAPKEEIEK